ncbi:uncharacterized protein [Dermacentor albipictus]|uniref:uncharacterized protein isoform X2 n=1 Tax=Dermacentor albipictus TaxID=60249 RepID=UPI0038FCAD48
MGAGIHSAGTKRWQSLRQKFLRLRKTYVKSGSSSDAVKKKWALFDNLTFLNDAIQSRSTVSNMEGGPSHVAPEVRHLCTLTPSSDSSMSPEALFQSLYMDGSEDTSLVEDVPIAQATDVTEVGDTLAPSTSLCDNDLAEGNRQGPSESGAGSSPCATACPTQPTGNKKGHFQKRKQANIDELMVTALIENREQLNELKSSSNTDQDELFLLSMKPLLARLHDRKKEMTKLRVHKLLMEAAFPSSVPGNDNESI